VPDIIAKSGVRLVEIGTTNRTHLEDYRRAIGADTAAILKVHRSNFAIEGFVADVPVSELAALAAPHGVPVVHDLGSGLLLALDAFGLAGEPTARDAIRAGASIVTMSGDKLLGGPQAGLIVGSRAIVGVLRRNPLARSYRVDKLTLAALEATLALYREPDRALREIPALAMLTAPVSALRHRAVRILALIARDDVDVADSEASVGGGAFPTARIPSVALSISGDAAAIERRLRLGDPPVIARIADDRVVADLRAVPEALDGELARAIIAALG
jgi:L-seryl-tRNA(Ser) seleniumtransferase